MKSPCQHSTGYFTLWKKQNICADVIKVMFLTTECFVFHATDDLYLWNCNLFISRRTLQATYHNLDMLYGHTNINIILILKVIFIGFIIGEVKDVYITDNYIKFFSHHQYDSLHFWKEQSNVITDQNNIFSRWQDAWHCKNAVELFVMIPIQ